jgi:gas vesicle protein
VCNSDSKCWKDKVNNRPDIEVLGDKKADFENIMQDLSKNVDWVKEKCFKSISNIEDKYENILSDLQELQKRVSSYDVVDIGQMMSPGRVNTVLRPNSQNPSQRIEQENKICVNVIEEMIGLVWYTHNSVSNLMETSYTEIEQLKSGIIEYNDLVENKIKQLPIVLSTSKLKSSSKENKSGNLYDLLVADSANIDKQEYTNQEVRDLSKQVKKWKCSYNNLFEVVKNNFRLMQKLAKIKESGPESVSTLKNLYQESNQQIMDILVDKGKILSSKKPKNGQRKDKIRNMSVDNSSHSKFNPVK